MPDKTLLLKDYSGGPPDDLSRVALCALAMSDPSGRGQIDIVDLRMLIKTAHRFVPLARLNYLVGLTGWMSLQKSEKVQIDGG